LVLKQQIQLTNLTEELQEVKISNQELEKEINNKNQEIYDVKIVLIENPYLVVECKDSEL